MVERDPMLRIHDMTYRVAGRVLFENASVTVPTGHRVGLVGRNGSGKTTLLRLIVGEAQVDQGAIDLAGIGPHEIGRVAQEAPGGAISPLDFVLAADRERASLLAEAETAKDGARIAEIQTRLADIGAHGAPARAASILAGLGFDNAAQARSLSTFSGGWRMRAALAAVLFRAPEFMILDEPTNHLDLEAALWLENYLKVYRGTLLIVSHDRDLLNRAVTSILHLEGCKLTLYEGAYDRFEKTRAERLALAAATQRKQDAARRHMQAFVDRFRYKASKARQAQSRLKALAKMETVNLAVSEPNTVFRFPAPEELAPPLVTFDKAAVGYTPGNPVLRDVSFRIDPDDRIGFLGQNGNGKSTLARLISGDLSAESGDFHRSNKLRVGYFAQDQVEALEPEDTAFDHVRRRLPDVTPTEVRSRLGGVGLIQERQDVPARHMSGGERARLSIALILVDKPNILILDEPTNHLDIDARDALADALNGFGGCVILISHDRRLLELTTERLWLVENGTVREFDNDLDGYRQSVLAARRARARDDKPAATKGDKKGDRQLAATRRKEIADLRKAAAAAERTLEKLTEKMAQLEKLLGDPAFYHNESTAKVQRAALHQKRLAAEIEAAENAWLAANEAIEAAP
ncbi:MAG: ABC-F family ATP-binding cassette domain-containing protein [Pseudomonadota bacterium]|nr:ABC-F family ATP-binding cassette domain-containing protein [Pseudomonadota bacterium]